MKSTEEIILIRYYNVLFYLFFEVGIDDLKRQCLVNRIGSGEPIRMKKIQEWCHCHQIPFKVSSSIKGSCVFGKKYCFSSGFFFVFFDL